ncbi:PTS sugar transporter subunit IIB [Alkalibacterium kapii]|uniref:PTS sugar transporter subunit IIB n=1 Tax=Alkalibacterium kapii TaxID=426704 RepID=UPI0011BFD429|nr:PTS sugar transporter subunit IIB [Alkalibacterium kapii]
MAQKTIMLVCTAGMSTSILVSEMKKVAEERKDEVSIFAVSEPEAEAKVKTKPVDILMLGPQVAHLKNKFKMLGYAEGFLVEIISRQDFRTLNGEKILDRALHVLDEGSFEEDEHV